MNARGINRRLMRHRHSTMFGRRAYLSVSIPLAVFPVPIPALDLPWASRTTNDWTGIWVDKNDDTHSWWISRVSSGARPDEENELWVYQHFIEESQYGGWDWWEGVERHGSFSTPIPGEFVAAVRARDAWVKKWCLGIDGPVGVQILDSMLMVEWYANSVYHDPTGDRMRWGWGVKFFYPDRKRGFCAALRRAFRVAKRSGVDMRFVGKDGGG